MEQAISPAIIAYALQRNHPDIYQKLQNEITSTLPVQKITEIKMLNLIVADFCQLLELKSPDWRDSRSMIACNAQQQREYRMTEIREMLLGVVLLLFQPERIYQVLPGQIKSGIIKSLSNILNVQKPTLSVGANTAITHFKAYKEFNSDVLYVYHQLINKRNYFDHGNN